MSHFLTILEVSQKQAYIFSSNMLKDNVVNSAVIAWIMSKSFKECAVEIAKEAAWAGFVVAATTAVELTLSEIRNNSQDDDEDDDEYY